MTFEKNKKKLAKSSADSEDEEEEEQEEEETKTNDEVKNKVKGKAVKNEQEDEEDEDEEEEEDVDMDKEAQNFVDKVEKKLMSNYEKRLQAKKINPTKSKLGGSLSKTIAHNDLVNKEEYKGMREEIVFNVIASDIFASLENHSRAEIHNKALRNVFGDYAVRSAVGDTIFDGTTSLKGTSLFTDVLLALIFQARDNKGTIADLITPQLMTGMGHTYLYNKRNSGRGAWESESKTRTVADEISYTQQEVQLDAVGGQAIVYRDQAEDSIIALVQDVLQTISEQIRNEIAESAIKANVTNRKGILNIAGLVEKTLDGSGDVGSVTAQVLATLQSAVSDTVSRQNGIFIGHHTVLYHLAGMLNSSNNPVDQNVLRSGFSQVLVGRPRVETDHMDNLDQANTGANKTFLAYGDITRALKFVQKGGVQTYIATQGEVDGIKLFDVNAIAYKARLRIGHNTQSADDIAVLRTGTA